MNGHWACYPRDGGPKSGTCAGPAAGYAVYAFLGCLPFVIACAPSIRGRLLCWLGALGKDGDAEQKAASVASLLGDTSFAEALTNAVQRFRAQPLTTLTLETLLSNETDPSLYAKTVPAKLGEVHAFMSHSWSDDGRLKHEKVHEWARELGGDDDKLVWLDKACIDQENIDASLAALPIYLSGCQQLLMLVGPTYITRMWCVMEVFIFMRIKDLGAGSTQLTSQLKVKLLGDTSNLTQTLACFDAKKAQCRYNRDRQRLLAMIEASFGTTAPFNKLVLEVLNAKVLGLKEVSRHSRVASRGASQGASTKADADVQITMQV